MATPGLRLSDIVDSFELERTGETTFSAGNVDIGGPMVYGGQILGQLLVAAQAMDPAKSPRTIHTVFAKPGSVDQPLEVDQVDTQRRIVGDLAVAVMRKQFAATDNDVNLALRRRGVDRP